MNNDFANIQGPKQSRHDNFEQLICQLLDAKFDTTSINGSGGDQGIDCFYVNQKGESVIFQVKYFLSTLGSSQKSQIKKSLDKALNKHKFQKWILCIPHDHTPSEKQWFDSLECKELTLEWWGETKIRNLIADYPEIGRMFFQEGVIVKELRRFEVEIKAALNRIKKHGFDGFDNLESNTAPQEYLHRAEQINKILKSDFELFDLKDKKTFISVDIMEIGHYAGLDSSLNTSQTVAEYCFENSPLPLVILPASMIELHSLISKLESQTIRTFNEPSRLDKEKLLTNFVTSFSNNPNSNIAKETFEKIYREYSAGFDAFWGASKIRNLLNNNLISFSEEKFLLQEEAQNIFQEITNSIRYKIGSFPSEHRYVYLENKYRDAVNLSSVLEWNRKNDNSARLISSDRILFNTSKVLFDEENPIRTLNQYTYLVYFLENIPAAERELYLHEMRDSIKEMTRLLNNDILSDLNLTNEVFRSFAPHYKNYLKPVDQMIYESFKLTPKHFKFNMKELYDFLTEEASITKAFERWWDYVVQELISINNLFPNYEETRKLLSSLKEKNS